MSSPHSRVRVSGVGRHGQKEPEGHFSFTQTRTLGSRRLGTAVLIHVWTRVDMWDKSCEGHRETWIIFSEESGSVWSSLC